MIKGWINELLEKTWGLDECIMSCTLVRTPRLLTSWNSLSPDKQPVHIDKIITFLFH